jgi:aminopeptidase
MTLSFEQKLANYADLAVKVGLNIQPGQHLIIRAPIESAPLARLIVASAYKSGARLVDVMWDDDAVTLARFQHAPRDSFKEFPTWRTEALRQHAQNGDAILSIYAADPDLLKDQDPELIAIAQKTALEHATPFRDYVMRDAINWSIVAYPIPAWAAKIYPDLPPAGQVADLWEAIFAVCRLDQADPVSAWQGHIKGLVARSDYLNHKAYAALKLTSPGTDLTVGLPPGHIWKSAQSTSAAGITFTPNMPTEEVFTLPHKDQTEGMVTASRPLSYGGNLIENFSLTFEHGRVVKVTAARGEVLLRSLIDTDEGAARLGEIALVPDSSPISQSGLLFYNTLFDENAASHIALGRAYKFTLEGGKAMSDEEFAAGGGNTSLTHVDFMIGSAQMNVDGIKENGSTEPVMRNGEWAFEV